MKYLAVLFAFALIASLGMVSLAAHGVAAETAAPSGATAPAVQSEEGGAKDESEDAADSAGISPAGGIKMQELLSEGFVIRTTALIPADMATRQLGKAAPDSVIVTLQKESAVAVCYYTLKAYVRLRLTDLRTCTAYR